VKVFLPPPPGSILYPSLAPFKKIAQFLKNRLLKYIYDIKMNFIKDLKN